MFFNYLGKDPLRVDIPGDQNPVTIYPSEFGQKTSNEFLYELLFSADFKDKSLFTKATSFDPISMEVGVKSIVIEPPPAKADEGSSKVKVGKEPANG